MAVGSPWNKHDVILQLRIQGNTGFFPQELINAFRQVDALLQEVDGQVVAQAAREFELGEEFENRANDALAREKDRRIIIRKVFGGSIVLEAAVAGGLILMLRYTILESVKSGWTETEVHRRIEEFIKKTIDQYQHLIAQKWELGERRAQLYVRFGRKVIRLKIAAPKDAAKVTLGEVRVQFDSLVKRIERYWDSIRGR